VGASLRSTTEDYKMDDLVIFESRWQQLIRSKGGEPSTWSEPVVLAPNNAKTQPHPGYDAWEEQDKLSTVDPVNLDLKENKATKRSSMKAVGNAPETAKLAEAYVINTQT